MKIRGCFYASPIGDTEPRRHGPVDAIAADPGDIGVLHGLQLVISFRIVAGFITAYAGTYQGVGRCAIPPSQFRAYWILLSKRSSRRAFSLENLVKRSNFAC